MLLADAWYTNAVLWGVLGLVGAAFGVWAAFYAAPAMRLRYRLTEPLPVIATKDVELTVHRNGVRIRDPHITTLLVGNDGRRDIPETQFSKSKPLIFEIGVPIVEVLQVTYSLDHAPAPAAFSDDTQMQIGPDLFHVDGVLKLTLLTDGCPPALTPPDRTLVDVQVQRLWFDGTDSVTGLPRAELAFNLGGFASYLAVVFLGLSILAASRGAADTSVISGSLAVLASLGAIRQVRSIRRHKRLWT